jgi:septal ring factor EnvC (AmiA/AmiB activator)
MVGAVEEPEDLTLLQLRELRQSISELVGAARDSRQRDQSIERQLAGLHALIAGMHADTIGLMHGLDAIRDRLERIERRLGLVEAPS